MDYGCFDLALLGNDSSIFGQEVVNSKNLLEKAEDKTLTEHFIQNLVIKKNEFLILVLGILSYNEQKLLNRIKTENKRKNVNSPLYVIHNLQTFTTKKQVQDYIREILLKSATFKLKEKEFIQSRNADNNKLNTSYFIEEFLNKEDRGIVVNHLIVAKEGSEAGDYYNKFSYNFIKNSISGCMNAEKFDIMKTLKFNFINYFKKILEKSDNSLEDFEEIEDKENHMKILKLKNNNEKDKKLDSKRFLIDELGFTNFFGTIFELKYSYYKIFVYKKLYICVAVELPGKCNYECKAINKDKLWTIIISGEKDLGIPEETNENYLVNIREKGKFNFKF